MWRRPLCCRPAYPGGGRGDTTAELPRAIVTVCLRKFSLPLPRQLLVDGDNSVLLRPLAITLSILSGLRDDSYKIRCYGVNATKIDSPTGWSPTMALHITDGVSSLLVAAAGAPSPDDQIADSEVFMYPIMVWYCIAGFVLFLPFCRIPGIIHRLARKSSPRCASRPRGVITFRRLPVAASHAFRALAFRWTFSIGKLYTFNVTECFITAAYIATLFSWSFVNCMLLPCRLTPYLLISCSNVNERQEI
jgi:hypothetical protein